MRHLRDFGFGKASLQDVIIEEFQVCLSRVTLHYVTNRRDVIELNLPQDLSDDIRKRVNSGEEIEVNLLFNSMTLNVLWRIVNGKGIDRDDPKQVETTHH